LVNKESLDNILKAEVFVNEDDNQLRAAHLILGYTPISRAFQAPSVLSRLEIRASIGSALPLKSFCSLRVL